MDVVKGDYRINRPEIAHTLEIDCNKTTICLPAATSAVFLIANFGKTWVSRRNI
jgi:hypothetical protein